MYTPYNSPLPLIESLNQTESKFARIEQSRSFKDKILEEQFDRFEFEKIVMLDNILEDFVKVSIVEVNRSTITSYSKLPLKS